MPNQFRKKFGRQERMKRVKALRASGQLKKENPITKLRDSVKGALGSLSRITDSSATRVTQGPKTKRLSPPTAQQAADKLIQTGKAASKPASTSNKKLSPVLAGRQRALEARLKKQAAKAEEKKASASRQEAAKSKEPKRKRNESITTYRQRLAKYRRENK